MEGAKQLLSAVLGGVNSALSALGVESSALASLGGAPNVEPLGEPYFSVTPFRYGDYIAKFSLIPVSPGLTRLEGLTIEAGHNANAIRDAARVRAVDEEMRFSVWTGLAAHQPLGNINRARRDTYRHSAAFRAGFNGCPIHEPASSPAPDAFPLDPRIERPQNDGPSRHHPDERAP